MSTRLCIDRKLYTVCSPFIGLLVPGTVTRVAYDSAPRSPRSGSAWPTEKHSYFFGVRKLNSLAPLVLDDFPIQVQDSVFSNKIALWRWGVRVGGGVHDSYTFQCGLVGSFSITSPGMDTIIQIEAALAGLAMPLI